MKAFRKLCITITAVFVLLAAVLNVCLLRTDNSSGIYRVEVKRLTDEITQTGSYDLSQYPHLTGVFTGDDLYTSDEPYVIIDGNDTLYRVEYTTENNHHDLMIVNSVFGAIFLILMCVLLYIRQHNLAVEIPEEKSRFFGKFTWGINLLRESIEDSRKRELSMQRDKKLLLLSLSHDIKTPLSAIKLNAKALEKGLYKEKDKQLAAAQSIGKRADEIEQFVSEITNAASEDFMTFEVTQSEVFLSSILAKINARYASQLALSGTEFAIENYDDCILSCDADRLAECLQNLIENAIKYGDGRQIKLSFDKVDGCELITVRNTGCTLEEKELPQIFESFHRGSNAAKVQGNGLGLFICKRLMSLMGGEVYAEIREKCFCVTLVVKLA